MVQGGWKEAPGGEKWEPDDQEEAAGGEGVDHEAAPRGDECGLQGSRRQQQEVRSWTRRRHQNVRVRISGQ